MMSLFRYKDIMTAHDNRIKEEAMEEGMEKGREETAINLFKMKMPIEMIAKASNVSVDTVKKWLEKAKKEGVL